MIKYITKPRFKPFGDAMSNTHRAGDADPSKAVIADSMKLVGNCSHWKTITNKERHRQVIFCENDDVPNLINSPFFRKLNPIDDDKYEVQSSKKKIKYNWIYLFQLDLLYTNKPNCVCCSFIMTF